MSNEIHHINSPSTLERRALCPASMNIELALAEPPQSEFAAEGTMLHEAVATGNLDLCENEDQRELVQKCLQYIEDLVCDGDKIYKELKLELIGSDWEIITFGTADVVIVGEKKLIVIDWKFGRGAVEYAINNIQGATYAAMAMQKFGIDECSFGIVQPRCGRWNDFYNFTECSNIIENIESIIRKCHDSDALAVPGETQCKYCRGLHYLSCKEIQNQVDTFVESELPAIKKHIKELCNNDLEKLHNQCKLIAKIHDKVKYRITKECEANGVCGNLTTKISNGGRECKDITALFNTVSEVVPQEDFLNSCSCSVSKVENLYATNRKSDGTYKTLKDGKAEFNGLVESLTANKANRVSIVEAKK